MKHMSMSQIKSWLLSFECCLFQPIWILQSGLIPQFFQVTFRCNMGQNKHNSSKSIAYQRRGKLRFTYLAKSGIS